MPNFKEFIKGFEEKPEPQKSQRDLDTEEHNKIVAQINAKAPKMKHEDYKAEIAKEDARFNSVQDKWEDEPKPQPKEAPKAEPKRPMTNKEIRDEHLKIKEKMDEKQKELGRKVNKEEYDEILNDVRNAPQPKEEPKTKYEGGIAKDMQDAGFEPYGVDERNQILRVKDAQGADYEISQGEGYSFNVYKDGKKIYENVPDYMRFDTVVAGKPEAGFERYQVQDDSDIEAPAPQPKQGSFEETFDENEPRMLYVVYDTPQGQVGDYIELDPDMSEDDIIDQLKENENVVGVYGGATNAGAFDPKWVRE